METFKAAEKNNWSITQGDYLMSKPNRRTILKTGLAGLLVSSIPVSAGAGTSGSGGIKQSVCRWCYGKMELEDLAASASRIGYKSIELIKPEDLPVLKKHGLTCAMIQGSGTISDCLNRIENHERIEKEVRESVDFAARENLPSVLCFSGNRKGMDDEQGLKNCAQGIKRFIGYAEKKGVTVCLELLNSKVNHKDYMADHTEWGVNLCKEVDSDRFKLLYDIYHMQIMEGDIIRTIRDSHQYIGHYHTAGVPGRNEIDDSQELYYPAIVKAIKQTGYDGFLGQEFIPVGDPVKAMEDAFRICNI